MSIRARIIITLLVAAVLPLLITQLYLYGFNPNLLVGNAILFLDLIAVLLALLFAMIVTSHFTLSLGDLIAMSKSIREGDYVVSQAGEDHDELGQLARALNEMSITLKEKTTHLSELLARDNAILKSINEGLLVTAEDNTVIFANDAAQRLLGWDAQELIGKRWPKDFGEVTTEEGEKVPPKELASSRLLTNGMRISRAEYKYPTKYSEPLLVAVSAAQFISGEHEKGVVVVFRDITQEKEIDKAKTEFVSLASHQLRTPLSTISWFSEVLLDEKKGELQEEQRRYLQEIHRGNRRMIHLVNALLDVSRLELGKFVMDREHVNIIGMAQDLVDELMPQVEEKEIQFFQHFDSTLPHFEGDSKIVRMVIQNLLSNAIKYTPREGNVSLRIAEEIPGVCTIVVKDTGYGIPKNQQDKIFTKLFRADNIRRRDTEGTGLGLYIVHSMVKQLGGTVDFVSKENEGTTFTVRIPLRPHEVDTVLSRVGTRNSSQKDHS